MSQYIIDIEANGLLPVVSAIHSIGLKSLTDGTETVFRSDRCDIKESLLSFIRNHNTISLIGHNVIGYDKPVLEKIFDINLNNIDWIDTLILSRVLEFDLDERDIRRKGLPTNLTGSHSLEAWGYRLNSRKGSFNGPWDVVSDAMVDYMVQDIRLTTVLYERLNGKLQKLKETHELTWLDIEKNIANICIKMHLDGFPFDKDKAAELVLDLEERLVNLDKQLLDIFPPRTVHKDYFTPKRDDVARGYKKGVTIERTEIETFSPSSRQQIISRLQHKYGWVPSEYTEKGNPILNEAVLSSLPWPEAKLLTERFTINKILGFLIAGDKGWLKLVQNGRIHGEVLPLGTATARASHRNPNLGQIPASQSNVPDNENYGKMCRSLFKPLDGHVLLGTDLKSLELRCLAHYLAKWDNGEYADIVLTGDPHQKTTDILGLPSRNTAKTWIYAYIYGAGDAKLGLITDPSIGPDQQRALGGRQRKMFENEIPALGNLINAVANVYRSRGFIYGLDNRPVGLRSKHAALNTLLQSAGAIIAKQWFINLVHDNEGLAYTPHMWVHDELQISVLDKDIDQVSNIAKKSANKAGMMLNFRVPIEADVKIGKSWAETH